MTQTENSTVLRKRNHLNYEERNKIEAWKQLERFLSNRTIANLLVRASQTINTGVKDSIVSQNKPQTHKDKSMNMSSLFTRST